MGGCQGHALQEQHTKRGHCTRRTRGPRSSTTRPRTKTRSQSSPRPGAVSSTRTLTAHLPDVDPVSPTSGLTSTESSTGSRPCLAGVPAGNHTHVPQEVLAAFQGVHAHLRSHIGSQACSSVCSTSGTPCPRPSGHHQLPSTVEQEMTSTEACRKSSQRCTTSFVGGPPSSPCGTHPDSLLLLRSPAQDPPQPGALACSAHWGRCTVMLSRRVSGAHSLP